MNTLKNLSKRALALVLALMMCVGMLSTTAFAAEEHTHNWVFDHVADGQLCTAIHTDVYRCSICGDTDRRTGQPAGHHNFVLGDYVGPYRHGVVCSKCYAAETREHRVDVAATCVSEAKCKCGKVMGPVDPNNHANLSAWQNDATNHWQKCTACNSSVELNKAAHDFGGDDVCDTCGYTKSTTPITPPAHEHDFGTNAKYERTNAATCTSPEQGKLTCPFDGCNATKDVTVGTALGHSFVDGVCERCGEKDPDYDFSCEHKWVTYSGVGITTEPTCVDNGIEYVVKCVNCGSVKETKVIAALGHDFSTHVGTASKEPTCTDQGVDVWKCSRCDERKVDILPKLDHDYDYSKPVSEVPATCTTDGTKTWKCKNCDATTETTVRAHHNYEEVKEVPATCTTAGTKAHYVCTVCGKLFQGTKEVTSDELVISVLGHKWTLWEKQEDGTYIRTCTVCGEIETAGADTKHEHTEDSVFTDKVVAVAPTCDDEGRTEGLRCGLCGEWIEGHESETIEALGHEWGRWIVTIPAYEYENGRETRTCQREGCGATENRILYATGTGTEIEDPDVPLDGDPDDGEVEIGDDAVPLANGPVTRAEFVDYLYRREGAPEASLSTFVDVPADHEYAEAIGWGQANDIAWGITEDEFAPDDLVTVAQAKLFLTRYAAFKGIEMPELAALVGLDDDEAAMNCDDILSEFFGGEE